MLKPSPSSQSINNELIVSLIRAGHPHGAELLYESYSRGMGFLAARYSREYAEDCVHDTVIAVLKQIQAGQLEIPAALPGYINTILKRTAWQKNEEARRRQGDQETFKVVVKTTADDRADPEILCKASEQAQRMKEELKQLKPVQREILTRFYLQGEAPGQICTAMNLTDTQFRLLKSRSKQILQEAVKIKIRTQPLRSRATTSAAVAVC